MAILCFFYLLGFDFLPATYLVGKGGRCGADVRHRLPLQFDKQRTDRQPGYYLLLFRDRSVYHDDAGVAGTEEMVGRGVPSCVRKYVDGISELANTQEPGSTNEPLNDE